MPALRFRVLHIAVVAWAVATGSPAAAGEAQASPADAAREVVEEVRPAPAAEAIEAWSKTVIDRALKRAAGDAAPGGAPTAEVLLFTSLAVPAQSWRAAARDAARIGAPLLLRGVAEGGLPATARRIAARLDDAKAGVAIDPRLFRLFGIERVPAVVVVPGGVPPCRSRGCSDDDPPPFDRVGGNLSLAAALEAIVSEGDAGRAVARRHLATLRGAEQ